MMCLGIKIDIAVSKTFQHLSLASNMLATVNVLKEFLF